MFVNWNKAQIKSNINAEIKVLKLQTEIKVN